ELTKPYRNEPVLANASGARNLRSPGFKSNPRTGPLREFNGCRVDARCPRGGIILFDLIRRSCLLMAPFHPAGGFFLLLFPPRPGFLPFLECFHFSSDQRPALGTREKDTSFRFFSSYRLNRRAPRLAPSVICLAA